MAALEGALAAKGGALEAGERGGVDVVLIRDATVHWLARHLLVPLALRAGHRDAGSCLEDGGADDLSTRLHLFWSSVLPPPFSYPRLGKWSWMGGCEQKGERRSVNPKWRFHTVMHGRQFPASAQGLLGVPWCLRLWFCLALGVCCKPDAFQLWVCEFAPLGCPDSS